MRNFRNLKIWKNGINLVSSIYKLSIALPGDERYGLKSQICRASVSVPSNIAEGCSRSSDLEYKRFLEIAMGSFFELETQLILILNLDLISEKLVNPIFDQVQTEQKMINGLISKLKSSRHSMLTAKNQ